MLADLFNHILRAVQLLALTVAPQAFSPEPAPSESPVFFGLLSAALLGAILYFAAWFRKEMDTGPARIAAALIWVSVAAALLVPLFFRGESGPLARGVLYLALPVWVGLAVTASTAADRYLVGGFKNRRMGGLIAVLAIGSLQYAYAAEMLGSRDKMIREALKRDPTNESAVGGMTKALVRGHKYDDARKVADRCLAVQPEACGCLEARAKIAVQRVSDRCFSAPPDVCSCQSAVLDNQARVQLFDVAQADARAAVAACPERPSSRAQLAEVLALRGSFEEAEQEATAGLAMSGAREDRLRYALALALQGRGQYDEATEQLNQAIKAGAGRDAKVLAGALALLKNDLDAAERFLKPVVAADPRDPVAAYNLALIADRRGNFNAAREGYLSTLRSDPCYASARYNLVHLTWKAGIQEEARHHAQKFAETAAPGDPQLEILSQLVGIPLLAGQPAP